MVNSACEYYVISAIFDLDKETHNALPFFMNSLDVTLYQVSFQRANAEHGMHGIKVNRKMYWQIFFSELGNKPSRLSLDQINML